MAKGASQSPAPDAPRYVARRGGFDYNRQALDRGQVLQLTGMPNDEKLIRLGYVVLLERGVELYRCNQCGQEFIGIAERTAHGDFHHRQRTLTPDEEDRLEERRETQDNALSPLFLDKTKAAQSAA